MWLQQRLTRAGHLDLACEKQIVQGHPQFLTLHIPALATLCHGGEDPGVVVALLHGQAAPVPLLLPHLLQLQKISEMKTKATHLHFEGLGCYGKLGRWPEPQKEVSNTLRE